MDHVFDQLYDKIICYLDNNHLVRLSITNKRNNKLINQYAYSKISNPLLVLNNSHMYDSIKSFLDEVAIKCKTCGWTLAKKSSMCCNCNDSLCVQCVEAYQFIFNCAEPRCKECHSIYSD
jgi:hypothetical protein